MLKAGVGGLVSLPLVGQVTAQSERSFTTYEAEFVRKHAALRVGLYTKFADRFRLTDELLLDQFRDSLPLGGPANLRDVSLREQYLFMADLATKGIVGSALTLQWYSETEAVSRISRTYDQGIIADGRASAYGMNRSASSDAAAENERLANRAVDVATAARSYQSNRSVANATRVSETLARERTALNSNTDTIQEWTTIDPRDYAVAPEGPETVQQVAQSNQAAVNGFKQILQEHERAVDATGTELVVPKFIDAYESNLAFVDEAVPESLRGVLFGDTLNLYFMNESGSTTIENVDFAISVSTGSNGTIQSYALLPQDNVDAHVYTTEETIRTIATADQPGSAAQAALNDDRITIEGKGLTNDIKYGSSVWFAENGGDLAGGVSDTIDDTVDGVTDAAGELTEGVSDWF